MLQFRNIYFSIGLIVLPIIALFVISTKYYDNIFQYNGKENEIWGLKIGDNVSDVKFKKGKPNICVYDDKQNVDYCLYVENYKPISFLKFKKNILQDIGTVQDRDERFRSLWGQNFETFQKNTMDFPLTLQIHRVKKEYIATQSATLLLALKKIGSLMCLFFQTLAHDSLSNSTHQAKTQFCLSKFQKLQ